MICRFVSPPLGPDLIQQQCDGLRWHTVKSIHGRQMEQSNLFNQWLLRQQTLQSQTESVCYMQQRVRTRDQQDDGGGFVVAKTKKRLFCNISDFNPMQIKNLIMLVRVKLVTSLTTWRCAACNLQLFIKHLTELFLVYYSHKKLLKLLPVIFQTNLPSDGPSLNN